MKISELAKELGYKTDELIKLATANGIEIKSIRATIDDKVASVIRAKITHKGQRTSALPKKTVKKASTTKTKKITAYKKVKRPKSKETPAESISPIESPKKTPPSVIKQPIVEEPKVLKGEKAPLIDVDKILGEEKEIRVIRVAEIDKYTREKEEEATKEKRFIKPSTKLTTAVIEPTPLKQKPKKPKPAMPEVGKPAPIEKITEISVPITVKDLSAAIGVKANIILRKLIDHSILVNINSSLDKDAVELITAELYKKVEIKKPKTTDISLILEEEKDKPENLLLRPPVVVFMGHVDHGKTSLLDRIRQTKIAAQESGGITQHIGASKARIGENKYVVFLDTPGHEAFTAMRARGANVTDVAVLVVAADDGVMPQTEEAINHARAASVPIVIALNKCDKKEANPNRVKHQLSQLGLIPEDWGGNTVFVEVSAITGQNIDLLVEMLSLEAELLELKANPNRPARGTVLEAKKTENKGIAATVLIQNGTLKRGDVVICGRAYGKIRAILDSTGKNIPSAPPSTPVEIFGLSDVPEAGDKLIAVVDIETARNISEERKIEHRQQQLKERTHVTLDNLYSHIESGGIKEVKIILKTDVKGSVEVLKESLKNITSHRAEGKDERHPAEEVKIRILHSAVGGINESDVILADASDAIIIGFNVIPEDRARTLAKDKGVDIRIYDVIYKAIEDMKAALEGMLEPEKVEVRIGYCTVKEVFKVSKVGTIAGCLVTDGKIARSSSIRLARDGKVIYSGKLESLKRFKDDAREVASGYECGLKIANYDDVKTGDVVEAFEVKEVARKLVGK